MGLRRHCEYLTRFGPRSISKPMACAKLMIWARVAFHENDGNHENDENDEDNSDSYTQGVECWIRGNHGNHENNENHENPGCKPEVSPNHGFRNTRTPQSNHTSETAMQKISTCIKRCEMPGDCDSDSCKGVACDVTCDCPRCRIARWGRAMRTRRVSHEGVEGCS